MIRPATAVAVILSAAAGLAVGACGSSDDSKSKTATKPLRKAIPIDVHYDPPADKTAEIAQSVLSAGGVSKVAEGISTNFALPKLLKIRVHNGDAGPFYDPKTATINLSYGFVDYEARVYNRFEPDLKQYDLGVRLGALDGFILMHEIGHALVDMFDLPITGREEDAVDELATVLMTQDIDGGDLYAFYAAQFFHYLSEDRKSYAESDYWDEHSLDSQRAYSIVCWVAGSNETAFENIKRLKILGDERLQRCPAEYTQKVSAWKKLLKPYARSGSTQAS